MRPLAFALAAALALAGMLAVWQTVWADSSYVYLHCAGNEIEVNEGDSFSVSGEGHQYAGDQNFFYSSELSVWWHTETETDTGVPHADSSDYENLGGVRVQIDQSDPNSNDN